MIKILVFGITENPGGVESVIMNYYRNIDRTQIQFDFLCNTKDVAYENEILKLGGKIYKISARSINKRQYKKDMNNFYKEHANEYKGIWVNVCSLANIDYLKYAKKYGIKIRIIHSHNSQNMDSKLRVLLHKINRKIIKKYATNFWTCSEEAGKWFYNEKIRRSNKYLLINNAIDTEKFKFNIKVRNEYRKKMRVEEKLVIGNIGRFHFQKNHTFIIDVFNEVYKQNKNAYLILIGQGEEEEKIKAKVEKLKLKDKVLFLGVRDDIPELLQMMDIFLFPSLFEGLSLSLIEAQANGLPIVTSEEATSKTIKMSNNLFAKSLKDNPIKWANFIKEIPLINQSDENIKIINSLGYNIKIESKKMEEFFIKN